MARLLIVIALFAACGKKPDAVPPPVKDDGSARIVTAPPIDAAPPVAPDASAPPPAADAAPATQADYMAALCPKVLPKIVECQKDATFIAALNVGADAKQKKITKSLLAEVAKWPDGMSCGDLAPAYQYGGFTYHWDQLAAVPDALDSCAKLGAAIQAAGGLFGGDQAN